MALVLEDLPMSMEITQIALNAQLVLCYGW
jgi:hypothetical protein